jgi:hypothetical protein
VSKVKWGIELRVTKGPHTVKIQVPIKVATEAEYEAAYQLLHVLSAQISCSETPRRRPRHDR